MTEPVTPPLDTSPLETLVARIETVARRRRESRPIGAPAVKRTERFLEHLAAHVRPRVRSLEAPLLVLLFGPTGAGKSSLFNALVERHASRVGVLRPTTREVVAVIRPSDREAVLGPGSALARVEPDRIRVVEDPAAPEGIALLDAPDLDSIEHANRELSVRLVEAADLGVFVTSAVRYADRVPWDALARVRERGLPLVVVLNRMPPDAVDAAAILRDVRRLLADAGVDDLAVETEETGRRPASPDDHRRVRIVTVAEGALHRTLPALAPEAVAPLRQIVDRLAADRDRRRALAARALAGSVAGLAPALDGLADDAEHEAIDVDALARVAHDIFLGELRTLREDLAHGTFLRAEAIRQWHEFVGADEVTRLFSQGIGKVRGTLSALVRGMPKAPVSEVRDETIDDLAVLARTRLAEAVRRTATAWATSPAVAPRVDDDASLWSPSPDLDARLRERLTGWASSIAEDVRRTGGSKRRLAFGASVGVNATGIAVMLATFSHTAGLTGAEVGIAAATGFLNQKLLQALFGEAALVEMIGRARKRLVDDLAEVFAEELARFEALVASGDELRSLAADARAAADQARRLPAALPPDLRAVLDPDALGWPPRIPIIAVRGDAPGQPAETTSPDEADSRANAADARADEADTRAEAGDPSPAFPR